MFTTLGNYLAHHITVIPSLTPSAPSHCLSFVHTLSVHLALTSFFSLPDHPALTSFFSFPDPPPLSPRFPTFLLPPIPLVILLWSSPSFPLQVLNLQYTHFISLCPFKWHFFLFTNGIVKGLYIYVYYDKSTIDNIYIYIYIYMYI